MFVPTRPRLSPRRLTAVSALLAAGLLVSACSSSGTSPSGQSPSPKGSSDSASSSSPAPAAAASSTSVPAVKPATKPVHISLLNGDSQDYGVGMPVIAQFNKKITSGVAMAKATTVTVNGQPAKAAWYFEYSDPASGHVMEAHLRMENYWPAHAKIHVGLATKGLSAGTGLSFNDSLTLDFTTHDRIIATVDDSSHRMTVTDDGKKYGTFPVSLGASDTPTARGIKVIMEKGRSICMSGPGYNECGIKFTQRLTYGGEYLHSAPWNVSHIDNGVDSSNGCTNLLPSDAQKLYGFLGIGDVVAYPNANGPAMTLGAGYGDWNVTWSQWQTGGAVPTA